MKTKAKTCRYHCSGCGQHFASLTLFDRHRQGEFGKDRHCSDPWVGTTKDRREPDRVEGVCRMYADEKECLVWTDTEASDGLRGVFG